MEPHLANFDFQFVVNPDLMRGDVAIHFDGVEVRDVAANRMASHYAEKPDNVAVVDGDSRCFDG